MSNEPVILATRGLVKEFAVGGRRHTMYQLLRARLAGGTEPPTRRRALDDINIEVRTGETIGIIGDNGAGKTTLLKTIAGLYAPTRGRIERRGEVALLAGLGVGMLDELSVAGNIRLYGALCGLSRQTIKERFDDIVHWAELAGFVAAELRTLSTGMRARLAFAITMHIDSELILMDEAFSTGDKRFQEKCDRFFQDSRTPRRTTLVATHRLDFVREFCERTLWLHGGRQAAFSATGEVLGRYLAFVPG
ncbi:MAG TPA: ATP-binding cassette domain-containing protein [Candidatus Methylomirabilis sp.]|nr:ATP-binding cassette domain-containing protein [Candidatus Methylomirabilis sp.]